LKLLILCLTLGALPGFSQKGVIPVPDLVSKSHVPLAPIALYTHFDHPAPQGVSEALQDELENIMQPIGMNFEWRSLHGVRGNEVSVELAVLTFKGHCDVAGLTGRSDPNPGALGWTHVSDGVILPFSDIDCDRIRSFVQRDLLSIRTPDREEAFGRALGRVLAHELYHIFANTSRHGSCGVGKSAYTVSELLAEEFQFEGQESQALRTSKAHTLLENASQPAAASSFIAPPEY
jgi:hypothetical protein